jgi:protein TonB
MSTIEIHEPELQGELQEELQRVKPVKVVARGTAAVLRRSELVLGPALPPRAMFSDSLLDFGTQKKRKALATTTSLILNCLVIVAMLAVPLIFTEELPKAQLLTFLVAPTPPPPPPPPAAADAQKAVHQIQTDVLDTGALRTPTRIPQKIQMIKEDDAPPPMATGGVVGGVPGGIPGGQLGGVIGSVISSTSSLSAVPRFVPVTPQRIRISGGVTRGLLIHREEPTYPPLARAARVQGDVVLSAIIDSNGQIQNLQLVSGHPMLVPAAIAAVKLWRYKPYLLNGQPVEVDTTITVIFVLSS